LVGNPTINQTHPPSSTICIQTNQNLSFVHECKVSRANFYVLSRYF
jgi:hypothetical protein